MKPASVNLAYLSVANPAPNVYIGGLMVTDRRGLPLEFRYTDPIQSTKIQQVLYGQVLHNYIKREVILETLLRNLEVSFKCLLVEDELLLEHSSKHYGVARIVMTKTPPIGPVGKRQELNGGEILLQITPEGSPLRLIQAHAAGNETKPIPANANPTATASTTPMGGLTDDLEVKSKTPDVAELLLDVGQTMELTEPLRRIEKALDMICQEEGITTGSPLSRSGSS